MHSQSKKWVSQSYQQRSERYQLNEARRSVCPNSPFWTQNFDRKKHIQEWACGERRRKYAMERFSTKSAEERIRLCGLGLPHPNPTPKRKPFDGKTFKTNRSNVLSRKTIFCPQWREGKEEIAPWPSKMEMEYEGSARKATEMIHGRFLGLPRVDGNATVNWQQRALVPQYAFEEYYYPLPSADDIFIRNHRIEDWEIDDVEGKEILGADVMSMLDPQDQW